MEAKRNAPNFPHEAVIGYPGKPSITERKSTGGTTQKKQSSTVNSHVQANIIADGLKGREVMLMLRAHVKRTVIYASERFTAPPHAVFRSPFIIWFRQCVYVDWNRPRRQASHYAACLHAQSLTHLCAIRILWAPGKEGCRPLPCGMQLLQWKYNFRQTKVHERSARVLRTSYLQFTIAPP